MKGRLIRHWQDLSIIKDKKLIEAFNQIPRERFIRDVYLDEAYGDYPLPIGQGQTISQPTTVMIMTEALEARQGHKILEVGAGSGYQAAILSKLVGKSGRIITTEYIKELAEFARSNIKRCDICNVQVISCDGSQGYEKEAPYDRIIVTAACPGIPKPLVEQLKEKGIIIAPVGSLFGQDMVKGIKIKGKLETKNLGSFVFVPLKGKHGYR